MKVKENAFSLRKSLLFLVFFLIFSSLVVADPNSFYFLDYQQSGGRPIIAYNPITKDPIYLNSDESPSDSFSYVDVDPFGGDDGKACRARNIVVGIFYAKTPEITLRINGEPEDPYYFYIYKLKKKESVSSPPRFYTDDFDTFLENNALENFQYEIFRRKKDSGIKTGACHDRDKKIINEITSGEYSYLDEFKQYFNNYLRNTFYIKYRNVFGYKGYEKFSDGIPISLEGPGWYLFFFVMENKNYDREKYRWAKDCYCGKYSSLLRLGDNADNYFWYFGYQYDSYFYQQFFSDLSQELANNPSSFTEDDIKTILTNQFDLDDVKAFAPTDDYSYYCEIAYGSSEFWDSNGGKCCDPRDIGNTNGKGPSDPLWAVCTEKGWINASELCNNYPDADDGVEEGYFDSAISSQNPLPYDICCGNLPDSTLKNIGESGDLGFVAGNDFTPSESRGKYVCLKQNDQWQWVDAKINTYSIISLQDGGKNIDLFANQETSPFCLSLGAYTPSVDVNDVQWFVCDRNNLLDYRDHSGAYFLDDFESPYSLCRDDDKNVLMANKSFICVQENQDSSKILQCGAYDILSNPSRSFDLGSSSWLLGEQWNSRYSPLTHTDIPFLNFGSNNPSERIFSYPSPTTPFVMNITDWSFAEALAFYADLSQEMDLEIANITLVFAEENTPNCYYENPLPLENLSHDGFMIYVLNLTDFLYMGPPNAPSSECNPLDTPQCVGNTAHKVCLWQSDHYAWVTQSCDSDKICQNGYCVCENPCTLEDDPYCNGDGNVVKCVIDPHSGCTKQEIIPCSDGCLQGVCVVSSPQGSCKGPSGISCSSYFDADPNGCFYTPYYPVDAPTQCSDVRGPDDCDENENCRDTYYCSGTFDCADLSEEQCNYIETQGGPCVWE